MVIDNLFSVIIEQEKSLEEEHDVVIVEDEQATVNLEDKHADVNLQDKHVDVNLEDEDVSLKDPFLSLLCFDYDDDEENDLSSLGDSSDSEIDYEKDVEDDEDGENEDVVYPCYDPSIDWKLEKPILTMIFESPTQLKEMLMDYGVSNGYQLVFTVNDNNRLLVRCGTEETKIDETGKKIKVWHCPFRLWASRVRDDDSFQIKSLNDQHTCSRQFCLGSLVTYTWIAKRFFKEIIRNPDITLRQMQEDMLRKYQCRVSIGRACDAFENGMSESFNSRIRLARRKPIISMFEEIRIFVMRRMYLMAEKSKSMQRKVCPRIRKKLEDIKKVQRNYNVIPSGINMFEVRSEKYAHVVKIQEKSCTCGSWQLSGIPCRHSVAVLSSIKKEPSDYVSNWFTKEMFQEAYKHGITPLKGSVHWPKTNDIKPLPSKSKANAR